MIFNIITAATLVSWVMVMLAGNEFKITLVQKRQSFSSSSTHSAVAAGQTLFIIHLVYELIWCLSLVCVCFNLERARLCISVPSARWLTKYKLEINWHAAICVLFWRRLSAETNWCSAELNGAAVSVWLCAHCVDACLADSIMMVADQSGIEVVYSTQHTGCRRKFHEIYLIAKHFNFFC